ncbi:disease resistance protein SUMM2-like [Vitis riparia]|uniref:disease resistance protein SUMM2-like n=1 Tax=Vitis riparia TaxID=96939 RepID=UPI00155AA585|nr:disease resistance protein SUMM2-like [Vitis riparia]
MEFVSSILEIVNRLWDCCDKRAVYIRQLPENLKSLREKMKELNNEYKDVKERVEKAQKLQKEIKHVVAGWIHDVESMEGEVNEMLTKGEEEIKKRCLGTCCPRNCLASYELGKMVPEKINAVSQLCSKAESFQEVAAPSPTLRVIELPLAETVGLDSLSEKVWRCLQDDKVRTIGLYGMGGVGKTTLLRRINNEFLKTSFEFDKVIYVVVSKPASVEKIQEMVLCQCDIPDNRWKSGARGGKQEEIYNFFKTRKFILLLDDIWEKQNLLDIGFPPLNDQNKSKVIFTTRFFDVCEAMGAEKIEVKCMKPEDAYALFRTNVGESIINSHPRIRKLANSVVKECKGVPLALMIAGGAMKGKTTPQEWEKKLKLLQTYPSEFPAMEKDLFRVLALSYDNLSTANVKSCFIYCSMFPEDWEIPYKQLIELWIGEGFLDEWHHIDDARAKGEEIIEQLKLACLLEGGQSEKHVKMHDVIRYIALWLAHENGKKKNKCVIKEPGRWIEGHEIAEWKETQRMSLWDNSIEDSTEPPDFRNLETLIASVVQSLCFHRLEWRRGIPLRGASVLETCE